MCVADGSFAPEDMSLEAIAGFAGAPRQAMAAPFGEEPLARRPCDPLVLDGTARQPSLEQTWARIEAVGKLATAAKKN